MASDTAAHERVFRCTRCGDCCRGFGGTYLAGDDILNISRHISVAPDRFVADFCERSGSRLVLRQRPDGYCVFWDGLCGIHPVKPRMCRQWPFIRSVLVDEVNWRSMASMCPGIRTAADMHTVRCCVEASITEERHNGPESRTGAGEREGLDE